MKNTHSHTVQPERELPTKKFSFSEHALARVEPRVLFPRNPALKDIRAAPNFEAGSLESTGTHPFSAVFPDTKVYCVAETNKLPTFLVCVFMLVRAGTAQTLLAHGSCHWGFTGEKMRTCGKKHRDKSFLCTWGHCEKFVILIDCFQILFNCITTRAL